MTTAFVDTDVLIRHLTGDPPDIAARASAALASCEHLLLADLVLAESRSPRSSVPRSLRRRSRSWTSRR